MAAHAWVPILSKAKPLLGSIRTQVTSPARTLNRGPRCRPEYRFAISAATQLWPSLIHCLWHIQEGSSASVVCSFLEVKYKEYKNLWISILFALVRQKKILRYITIATEIEYFSFQLMPCILTLSLEYCCFKKREVKQVTDFNIAGSFLA